MRMARPLGCGTGAPLPAFQTGGANPPICTLVYIKMPTYSIEMPNVPKLEPIKVKEFEVKQSKYEQVPKLPLRAMIVGPSGCGKTILLQNLVLDVYRGCFSRVYIWSPSIDIDHTWQPVKDYIAKEIKPSKDEKIYFDSYHSADLQHVIDTQYKIAEHMKKHDHKKIYQILIVVDDFADDVSFTRHSTLLHQLYIRGRHQMVSTITATGLQANIDNNQKEQHGPDGLQAP